MGKKKGNANETEAAEVVAGTLEPAVSTEHDASAPAPVVEGDGPGAAFADGAEHQGEPAGTPGEADGAAVVDGSGDPGAETEGEAPEGVASATVHESEGVSDDAGEDPGEGEGDASGDEFGAVPDPGKGSDPGSDLAARGGEDAGGPGADGRGDGAPDDDGQHFGAGVSQGGIDAGAAGNGEGGPSDDPAAEDGGAVGGGFNDAQPTDPGGNPANDGYPGEPARGEWTLDRVALCGAVGAYKEALIHGAWLEATMRGADALDPQMTDAAYDDMAAYVRKIGDRATPDVLAQQLVIRKHRASAEISSAERIAFTAFSGVLLGLDRYVASERERIARENADAEMRPPVPIDETTMELVDAPLATWGGRG